MSCLVLFSSRFSERFYERIFRSVLDTNLLPVQTVQQSSLIQDLPFPLWNQKELSCSHISTSWKFYIPVLPTIIVCIPCGSFAFTKLCRPVWGIVALSSFADHYSPTHHAWIFPWCCRVWFSLLSSFGSILIIFQLNALPLSSVSEFTSWVPSVPNWQMLFVGNTYFEHCHQFE